MEIRDRLSYGSARDDLGISWGYSRGGSFLTGAPSYFPATNFHLTLTMYNLYNHEIGYV